MRNNDCSQNIRLLKSSNNKLQNKMRSLNTKHHGSTPNNIKKTPYKHEKYNLTRNPNVHEDMLTRAIYKVQ